MTLIRSIDRLRDSVDRGNALAKERIEVDKQLLEASKQIAGALPATQAALAGIEEALLIATDAINQRLIEVANLLVKVLEKLGGTDPEPPQPIGIFFGRLLREEENEMLVFEYDLPTLKPGTDADDVVRGEMRFTYDGVPQPAIETLVGATVSGEVKHPKGINLDGVFVFVDDDGNESGTPMPLNNPGVTKDTILPPNPEGSFGGRLLREEPDA